MLRRLCFILMLLITGEVRAAWLDANYPYRRSLDVEWPADKAGSDEIAVADFYTAGYSKGTDVRVAADDAKSLPVLLLQAGPGDRVRVAFLLPRNMKHFYAYFGNPNPAKPAPELTVNWGLLLEMRKFGGDARDFAQMEADWQHSGDVIGKMMLDKFYIGINPFGENQPHMSKISGQFFAPVDGIYTFAASASNRGALYIDNKPLIFAPRAVNDVQFNADMDLKRGRHDITFYQICVEGDPRLSVAWKRPDLNKFDLMPAETFGLVGRAVVGPLEQNEKTLTADFRIEYMGECFYDNHYSHRYRFTAQLAKPFPGAKFDWDLGDGQSASGAVVEHVYLADGPNTVRLTARVGANSDAQSNVIYARRLYEQLDKPPGDTFPVQAKIVKDYDPARIPAAQLCWAVTLLERSDMTDAALLCAKQLAVTRDKIQAENALESLYAITRDLVDHGKDDAARQLWEAANDNEQLRPMASRQLGRLLLWRTGEIDRAVTILAPYAKDKDEQMRRLYAQALVLDQKADEGKRILAEIPIQGPPERQAAVAGALARTIEFYISQGDWESGEDSWETWQQKYPADFMEGYSLLLKTKLMEIKKSPEAAAKIAEAFALAVPESSYSPQLLDRASKLLAKSNPQKSQALHQLLRQKYPEDPLSQEGGK